MKKVFISQPMNGRTDTEIKAERERIVNELVNCLGEEIEVIDSFFDDKHLNPSKNRELQHLGKSIELMADADIVYFASGWEKARGCVIERECAK